MTPHGSDLVRYAARVKPPGEEWRRVYVNEHGKVRWHKQHGHGHLTVPETHTVQRWAIEKYGSRVRVGFQPIQRFPNLIGDLDCDVELLRRLQHAMEVLSEKEDRKVVCRIRSGRRTLAEQTALWNQNMHQVNGAWVPRPGRPLTARPNANAPHVLGHAADCSIDGINFGEYPAARPAAAKAGLAFTVPGESWHLEVAR